MSLGNNQDSNGYGLLPPIQFEDTAGLDMSDSSNRRYHKPPSEYKHEIRHLGWTDGTGSPPTTTWPSSPPRLNSPGRSVPQRPTPG
jgi:hypothetical protein